MSPAFKNIVIFYMLLTNVILNGTCYTYEREHEYETAQNLSEAIMEIVKSLFVQKLHLIEFNLQVQVEVKNQKYLHFYNEIIDEIIHMSSADIGVRLGYGIPIPADQEQYFSILLVDSKNSLEFLYKNISKYHLNIDHSFFIILHTFPNANHYYDELLDIFELNWRNGLAHANVLVHAVQDLILLFYYLPFTPYHCKAAVPVVRNKFIDGQWLHKEFVEGKMSDLHGCPLVCGTWEDMPYFQLNRHSTSDRSKYRGIEGKLLEYLAEKMNFTVNIRFMNDEEINQTIYDEKAILDKLFQTGTEFVIGAFRYKPSSLNDSYVPTTAYYMSSYYFIVSSKTDPYDPFTKLLLPFDTEIWLILIFIFVFANTIVCIVTYLDRQLKHIVLGRKNTTPAYNMIVVGLGGPVDKDPKIPFSRFLLMLWLLTTFILRVVYQGFMYHYIRNDLHKPPPKVIADLFTDEYRILMSEMLYNDIKNLHNLQKKAEILNTSEVKAFEMLRHPLDYKPYKLSILTAEEYFKYYQFIAPINYDFYVVPQKLFTQQLTIYMKKNSPYLTRFNMYIENYINEGLKNKWQHGRVSYRKPTDNRPKPMKISNLYGAYRVLVIGLTGSLFVFMGELCAFLISIYCKRIRKTRQRLFRRNLRTLEIKYKV